VHCSFRRLRGEFEVWVVFNEVQTVAVDRNLLTRRTKRRWNVFYRYFNMNGAKINFDIRSNCSVCYLWWKFTLWLWMRVLSEMKLIEWWFRRVHSPALPCPAMPNPLTTPAFLICIHSNSNNRHTEQSANESSDRSSTMYCACSWNARSTHYAKFTLCVQYADLQQLRITPVQGLWVTLMKQTPLHVIEAYGWKGCIAPLILCLGFMCRWWVNCTPLGDRTQVPIE
jgi:hypothetical protein